MIVVTVTIDDVVEVVSVVLTNVVVVTDVSGCPDCRFMLLALPLLEFSGASDNNGIYLFKLNVRVITNQHVTLSLHLM